MASQGAVPNTVEVVHGRVVALLKDETDLSERLDTRGSWVAGFAGVVLSLSVALRNQLSALAPLDQPAQDVLFILSVATLALAALASVLGLWPRAYWHTSLIQVLAWQGMLGRSTDEVLIPEIHQLSTGIAVARATNNAKIWRLRAAVALLLLGLVGVASQAAVGIL
jgi:hypothetical protein